MNVDLILNVDKIINDPSTDQELDLHMKLLRRPWHNTVEEQQ